MVASAEDQAWINGQTLFFAEPLATDWVDPVGLAEAIGMICNLSRFEAIGSQRHYLHRSGMLLIGDTAITSAAFLPQQGATDDFDQCLIELPLSIGTGTTFTIEGKEYHCHGGVQGLFLPGQAMKATSSDRTATLGFNLDPARLSALLVDLTQGAFTLEQARLALQRPHSIDLGDPRVRELWQWLRSMLRMLESSSQSLADPQAPLALAFEELLYRASLLMLRPELIHTAPLAEPSFTRLLASCR